MLNGFNRVVFVLFLLAYCYQIGYALIVLFKKKKERPALKNHRYAVLIAARNEAKVIGNLIESIHRQNYPQELIDIFVIADNCTDDTALLARQSGAVVFERFNQIRIGKGYALDFGFKRLMENYWNRHYEGFFIFDADNLLDQNYVAEMNRVFDSGVQVITSYRNSKNYDTNWISAGYSLWFLRESRYLNEARMLLNTSCAISGTGFLLSRKIVECNNGWKHHLLTEDIEFSVDCVLNGIKIGYCGSAMLYDEQPVTMEQSWKQRLRWSKGFYQVFGQYGKRLAKGAFLQRDFACYDMLMTISPALFLSLTSVAINAAALLAALIRGQSTELIHITLGAISASVMNYYLVLFAFGLLTTVSEWKKIQASAWSKILYLFTFPIFIFTYVPISIQALWKKIEWDPIEHTISKRVGQLR